MAKQQLVKLTQTGRGYVVRRFSGNKVLSERNTKTLKAADKIVVAEKRKAFKATGQKAVLGGIAIQPKKKKRTAPQKRTSFGFGRYSFF